MEKLGTMLNIKDRGIPVMSNREFLQEKIKSYNEAEGNLNQTDDIDCPICKNKGYVMFEKYIEMYDDYTEFLKPCECIERRKIVNNALKSGLGEYLKVRSKDYVVDQEWMKPHKQLMVSYCKEHSTDDTWFMTLGQSGCGKTLMGSIIANHLLYNVEREVVYITWTDFISKAKRDMMGDNTNEVSKYLDYIKEVDVLFIDELLKKYNETDLKYIIEIINYRYQNNKKTIITSEHTIESLLNIDQATFSRAFQKSKPYLINTPEDKSKNYRLRGLI